MEEKGKEDTTPEGVKQRIEEECQRIVIAAQEAKEQAEAMKALASCLSSLARRLQSSLLPTPPPSTNETQSTEIAAPSEDNIAEAN